MKGMCPYNFVVPGFKHGNEGHRSGGIQRTCLFEKSSRKKGTNDHTMKPLKRNWKKCLLKKNLN